tara:strand:- start:47 stop:247 length:201 start_codon:yes stop_codon:yes gene_type:complete
MVKKDLKIWSKFREGKKSTITHKEYEMICDFHANYLDHPLEKPCTCSPKRIKQMIEDLHKIWEDSQ